MTTRLRKAVDWSVGLALIALGIVGGFVPLVQGWIFVLAGLAVLSSHSAVARRIHERIKETLRAVPRPGRRATRSRRSADPPGSA